MRAELEALGEDVCSSEEERFAEDGAFSSLENARGAAGDPARSPPYGRAWGWDRDPVEDVQRAWKRREARLRRNSASFKVDDECSPDAPRDDAPASSASASSGDETSSEGETRETRAAFLRAYEARERARAQARESRRAAALRDEEAAETGVEAAKKKKRAEAEMAPASAPDVFERHKEGLPSSAGTTAVFDAAELGSVPERTRATRGLCALASEAVSSDAAAALAIQSRWRGVRRAPPPARARDAARRRAAEEASSLRRPAFVRRRGRGGLHATRGPGPGRGGDAAFERRGDRDRANPRAREYAVASRVRVRAAARRRSRPRRAPRGSAPAIAAALEAAATEWGFRASGPAEEAFLRHRARLHVEARRRARREQLKDPLERVARFRAARGGDGAEKKGDACRVRLFFFIRVPHMSLITLSSRLDGSDATEAARGGRAFASRDESSCTARRVVPPRKEKEKRVRLRTL